MIAVTWKRFLIKESNNCASNSEVDGIVSSLNNPNL
jgi:hypothetical protein